MKEGVFSCFPMRATQRVCTRFVGMQTKSGPSTQGCGLVLRSSIGCCGYVVDGCSRRRFLFRCESVANQDIIELGLRGGRGSLYRMRGTTEVKL